MGALGSILISILVGIMYGIALLIYFNLEEIKKQENYKNKLKAMIKMDKKSKWLTLAAVMSGVLFFILEYFAYGKDMINSLRWQTAAMMMLPIGCIDMREQIIPNATLIIGLIFAVPLLLIQTIMYPDMAWSSAGSAIIGAVVAGGIFFIGALAVKNGVGAGDIKMNFVLGLMVGFVGIFNILLYSMLISAITGIVLIIVKKKKSKDVLPLAPFTLLGVVLAIVLGV